MQHVNIISTENLGSYDNVIEKIGMPEKGLICKALKIRWRKKFSQEFVVS